MCIYIYIEYILGELLMLCHGYAPKPLLYHKRSFNKKVCRYTEESIPLKKFGKGPHGAMWDPDLLRAARWWCVPMAIEHSIR